jgi:hypothetical protein
MTQYIIESRPNLPQYSSVDPSDLDWTLEMSLSLPDSTKAWQWALEIEGESDGTRVCRVRSAR